MTKLMIAIMLGLSGTVARAENEATATSKEYVDTELATKQPAIPAVGNNVVMTFDSTAADGIGTKPIYNETTTYTTQQTALMTAGTANNAMQMAINGELICTKYSDFDPTDCWLWGIKSEYYKQYDFVRGIQQNKIFNNNHLASVTFDADTKIATILVASGSNNGNAYFMSVLSDSSVRHNYIDGHKYYFRAKMRTTAPGVNYVFIGRETQSNVYLDATTEWGIHDAIFQAKFADANPDHYPVIYCSYTGGGQGIQIDLNEFGVYDLTDIFGAGNEPATADDAARALGLLYLPSNQ